MGLVGEPSLLGSICAACHGAQDTFRTRQLAANGSNRNAALAGTEKGTQVTIANGVKDDTLSILVVEYSFARLQLGFGLRFQALVSGDAQVEQPSRLGALAQQDLLRIIEGLAPQDAAEIQGFLAVRGRAAPGYRLGSRIDLDPSLAGGQPKDQGHLPS